MMILGLGREHRFVWELKTDFLHEPSFTHETTMGSI